MDPATPKPVLILGGADLPHTSDPDHQKILQRLRPYTRFIRHEAKDSVEPVFVATSPCGLTEMYYHGYEGVMLRAITEASVHDKTELVMASWGYFQTRLRRVNSRSALGEWLLDNDFVQRTVVSNADWFPTVSKHKFLLTPQGAGVQTPKVVEALLVLTIPVVDTVPAYLDLQREGWPILVVDEWDDITPELLARTWHELSPRLESFRREVLSGDGFFDFLTKEPPQHEAENNLRER